MKSYAETLSHFHNVLNAVPIRRECAMDESVTAWVAAMYAAVNAERESHGFDPVAPRAIVQAEINASGHCDYFSTFAINCTRIVFGMPLDP